MKGKVRTALSSFLLPPSSFLLLCFSSACADQVGIDKARLFEEPAGQYVLEVDTTPLFVAAYREPILPERFEVTQFQRERQAGLLVLRYRFRSRGEPLGGDDELLLPWGRSGTFITAQWNDGSVHQNLFMRDLEGIRVRIRMLKASEESAVDLGMRDLRAGLTHARLGWNHWLLIAAVGLLARGWWRIGLMLYFAVGHAISLVVVDLGALVVPIEAAEICVVVVVLLIARAASVEVELSRRFVPVMLILGLLHGVANAQSLRQSGTSEVELVRALFTFNLGIDAVQTLTVAVIAACVLAVSRVRTPQVISWTIRAAVGGAAVALLLTALTGSRIWLDTSAASRRDVGQFELPVAQVAVPGGGARPRPARGLTEPLASFLTVEPFEIRLEVLMRLKHVGMWIDLPSDQNIIDMDQQEHVKRQAIDVIIERTVIDIDGIESEPVTGRADFVTVEPGGIYSRPSPQRELLDEAIVGVVFIYESIELPDEVSLDWSLFSSEIQSVPVTTTDPFGGNQKQLSPDAPRLTWNNRWSGYRPPEIKPVAVAKPRLPLLSALLAVAAVAGYSLLVRTRRKRLAEIGSIVVLTAAFVLYPFARVSVGSPLLAVWKPSPEQAADILDRLLTNVYRAYDLREEEAIYDRLALTITGQQLTEIYLDTRRSLELENRGGARVKVDEVEIGEIRSIRPINDGGFAVELTWKVSGSVSHFGHTHYRRNRCQALVTIVPAEGHWKIQSIEVEQQQRML